MSQKPIQSPQLRRGAFGILWRCLLYLKPYWKLTLGIYVSMIAINAVSLITPQMIRLSVDRGIYGNDSAFLSLSILALLSLTAVKGVFIYFQGGWTEIASQNVAYDLRNQIQQKLNQLSFSFHDRSESGQILSRTIQDVERIRFLTGRAVLRIVEGGTLLVTTAAVLVWMNPGLGLLIVATLPFLVHRAYVFGRQFRPLSLVIQNQLGVLTTRIEQNLRGAQVVKGFAQENAEIERYVKENEDWFRLSVRAGRIQAVNEPMLTLIANFGTVLILLYGGLLVTRDQLTLGELIAFTTYLAQLVRPVQLMGRILPVLAMAASAGERIFEILDAPTEIQDAPDAVDIGRINGRVKFENVSFGYSQSYSVIHDVSFEVQPGSVVALLGATGSGKSTIINLITRFYDPTSGKITIDGIDSRKIKLHSLREQIGIVLQDTTLFAASIRENITFGRPDASLEAVVAAAQDAQAHEFIMALPNSYDTRVGERGLTLSGGQKQRIAIARALLTDPRILILDDATSSVDARTERQIQAALERLMEGRTTFVIAHRLSTVRRADLILLLEKGRILASGTHESLQKSSPHYAEIFQVQLRPQERTLFLEGR